MTPTLTISDPLAAGAYTLTATSAPSPAPTPAPTPTAATVRKWIGLNLTGMGSTNREYPFADWVKFARKFGTAAKTYDSSAPIDPDGWPTDDFGIFWDQCRDVNGDYQVIAAGQVTFKAFSASVSKPTYNAASNTTTATLTFAQDAGKVFAPSLAVYTGHKGCKSIRVLGKANQAYPTFSDDFVKSLDGDFRCLRFMDWAETNFSQQAKWSDRPKPTDAQWSIKGVPWETCIDLCNWLGADGWFNVPCMADDDYVANMLALINSRLHPSLTPIIEYSNELWNAGTFGGSLGQATQHASATLADIAAGDRTLSLPSDPSGGIYAQYRRVAKRSYQIQQIAEKIAPGRFKIVLPIGVNAGWQMLTKMLDWTKANAGKPSSVFTAVAVAPYFSEGKTLAAQADATVDQLLDGFADGIAGAVENLPAVSQVCLSEGLGLWCYEMGGDSKQVNVNVPNKIAAMEHPRMGQITSDFLSAVYQHADGGCWFADANAYDKNNMFGLRQHARELYTPKYLAVKAFMRGLAAGSSGQ